ncbi:MAG TPA: DUF6799 domain-containing protein [Puia sp.]|jgi:hypothetical protein|nr:DUF6799 domain-containing protein [Puia sp.]
MKKFLFAALLMIIGYGGFAQTSKPMNDYYVMKDGKVISMKGGKEATLAKTTKLSNGEMIMKDGNVKMKDGSMMMLKEGQYVDVNGKMGMLMDDKMDKMGKMDKMDKMDKMKMDSTK